MDFSIVIDTDRGHCYEHFQKKKYQIMIKIEPLTCIRMFRYEINFELPEIARK